MQVGRKWVAVLPVRCSDCRGTVFAEKALLVCSLVPCNGCLPSKDSHNGNQPWLLRFVEWRLDHNATKRFCAGEGIRDAGGSPLKSCKGTIQTSLFPHELNLSLSKQRWANPIRATGPNVKKRGAVATLNVFSWLYQYDHSPNESHIDSLNLHVDVAQQIQTSI